VNQESDVRDQESEVHVALRAGKDRKKPWNIQLFLSAALPPVTDLIPDP
jgi:hypothetical protein